MRRFVMCGALLLGCGDGYSHASSGFLGAPGFVDFGSMADCEFTLDAPTPLGLSGAQLLARYGGEFDVKLASRTQTSREFGRPESVRVMITYRDDEDATACGALAVPVTVSIQGETLMLSEPGTLMGTPLAAQLAFAGEDVFGGIISFQQGRRTIDFVHNDVAWTAADAP